MGYEIAQASLCGDRENNQDRLAWVEADGGVLLVLADGMGGHPRGELAAEIAVQTLGAAYRAAPHPLPNPDAFLSGAFERAHAEIVAAGRRERPPVDPHTTCVAVVVEGGRAHWAHVGDSRLYRVRADGGAEHTRDHNAAEDLYREGAIDAAARRTHPLRHVVTRALGGAGPGRVPTGGGVALVPGDLLVLCSDGLLALPQERLLVGLRAPGPLQVRVDALARAAVEAARPRSDNVSVLALAWAPEAALRAPRPGVMR